VHGDKVRAGSSKILEMRFGMQHHQMAVERKSSMRANLLYRLRAMTPEAWRALPDLSEGIEDRLRAAAGACASRERLLLTAKTRRYPYARLSRLCTHALLDITDETLAAQPLAEEPWLLGLRDSALPLLRQAKAHGVSIISKAADLRTAAPWFRA